MKFIIALIAVFLFAGCEKKQPSELNSAVIIAKEVTVNTTCDCARYYFKLSNGTVVRVDYYGYLLSHVGDTVSID